MNRIATLNRHSFTKKTCLFFVAVFYALLCFSCATDSKNIEVQKQNDFEQIDLENQEAEKLQKEKEERKRLFYQTHFADGSPIYTTENLWNDKDSILLLFAGDIMAHAPNWSFGKYENIYADIAPIVKEADLSFANLETPVDKNVPYSTYPNFNVHSAYAQATFDAGFCVFSLANNHTNDQGRDGIIETRNYFSEVRESTKDSERPIYSAGLKEKSGGDLTYEVIEKNGWKILFVAFTELLNSPTASSWIDYIPPTKERRESLIKELVKLRKENPCDLFVVSIHTSEPEYVFEITEKQKNFYYDLLESSADVIWCNHPHVSKKWEVVNIQGKAKKIIFYDMGNTISAQRTNPQFKNPETLRDYTGDGYMARVRFVKNQGETQIVFVDPILLTTYITPENQYVIKILNDNFLSELKSQENHKWADYLFERKKLMEKIKGTTTWQ